MIRVGGQATVSAIDVKTFAAVPPALARRWRALRFEQGVYISATGQRREGLRVDQGAHPRPGVRYVVVLDAAETAEPASTTLLSLLADDRRRIGIRMQPVGGPDIIEAELHRPDRPERITVSVTGTAAGRWPVGGPFAIEANLDLADLAPAASGPPQLVVKARHRRAIGRVEAAVSAAGTGAWTVDVRISGRGRGWARPVVAFLSPLLQRYAQPWVDALIRQLPADVEKFNRDLREKFGPSVHPEQLADLLLDEFLKAVATRVA